MSELVHVPPLVPELSVVVAATQTFVVPVMAAGRGLTVKGVTLLQPVVPKVNVILTAPAVTPVALVVEPGEVSETDPAPLLVQVPLPPGDVNVLSDATQTFIVPVMAAGSELTTTGAVTVVLQPEPETV